MSTIIKLGPADHGRPMTVEELRRGEYEEGYRYELIDGRLYVSPEANLPEAYLNRWIDRKLQRYSDEHPEVINFVYPCARVFVPGRPGTTIPEPDLALYHDFPLDIPIGEMNWEDVSPLLVIEVLVGADPDKDLVRNSELYHQVPSIKEYWVLDGRDDPDHPTLIVHRRWGSRWRIIRVGFGETYSTRVLPGFELVVDPRR